MAHTTRLWMFVCERGKIRSRRVTGVTVQQRREVATAIKTAREMALILLWGWRGADVGGEGLEPATNGLPTHSPGQFRLFRVFCCAAE
jgi:hypothetical protein